MSFEALTIAVSVIWLLIGVSLGVLMGRRGYSAFGWGVTGAILGPIGIAVAVFADRAPLAGEVIDLGRPGSGPIDVLVGADGSTEARAAVTSVSVDFSKLAAPETVLTRFGIRSARRW